MWPTETIYIPAFDRAGQKALECLAERDFRHRVWRWYHNRGYAVVTTRDVDRVPFSLVEERVSRLRQQWRHWIWGESACSWFLGPAGIVMGGPALTFVLIAWSIEMGWAYGQDMTDRVQLEHLRNVVPSRLLKALGVPPRCLPLTPWKRFAATVVFWGFGPEMHAADVVMAEMRAEFRHKWESRRKPSPFTA